MTVAERRAAIERTAGALTDVYPPGYLPDCCVLLAAEAVDGGVPTFDERLAAAAAERGFAV